METDSDKQEEENKEEQIKTTKNFIIIILGVAIIFILILGITKYLGIKGYESAEYNGFEFIKSNNVWNFQWQDKQQLYNIGLRYNPIETKDIYIFGNLNKSFSIRDKIYVTFDPALESKEMKFVLLGTYELLQTMMGPLKRKAIMSCVKNETETCQNAPIITCDNKNESIIYLSYNEPTQIELKENCIIIQGKELELVRAVDRLLYQWLKVSV